MPTLDDVAARAKVSKATASRALSRPDLVAPATTQRVRAAAMELGFVPNRAARELARGRSGILALVVPTLDNSFFTPIIGGAQTRAQEADLQLTVTVHPLEAPAELAGFERLATQVDGIIIVAPRGADDVVRQAGALKPAVLVDREIAGMTSVVADTATAFAALVRGLAESGHKYLVYIGGPDLSWQNSQRTMAVRDAAAAAGVQLEVISPYRATFASGTALVDAVAASRATAAIPYAADLGLGLLFGLHARGLASLGRASARGEHAAIEVVGVPDAPGVDVDGEQLGARAMDYLIATLGGRTPEPPQLRLGVPVRWPRASRPPQV